MIYKFEAIDSLGNVVKDEIEASTFEEFLETLDRKGLYLVKYSTKKTSFSLFKKKVTRKELAEFLHNLAFMVKSGIPLLSAMEELVSEVKNPELVRKVRKVLSDINSGMAFSEAVERVKLFPPIVIALIRVGEESGRLDKTLEQASEHLYRIDEIISDTKKALTYPTFVMFAMTGAFSIWFFYVLPQLTEMFKSMNLKLPAMTQYLLDFSHMLKAYILQFLVLIGIVGFVTFLLYKNGKTQIYVEKVVLKLPIIGRIKRTSFLAFFFEFFSLLLNSGVDLLKSLSIMESSFYTQYPKKVVKDLEKMLLEGNTISESMAKVPVFKRLDIRIVSVGEATGRLPEQLQLLSDFYYKEVKELVEKLPKVIEPVLITSAGLIFLVIIVSLLAPVYQLVSKMGM
ncbi:MAG: type II secretion system F family protein [Thermodesulfobacteria bacterium]|nr:type II secretion system F family protein [Thermodesulfobacteriota bacterium]